MVEHDFVTLNSILLESISCITGIPVFLSIYETRTDCTPLPNLIKFRLQQISRAVNLVLTFLSRFTKIVLSILWSKNCGKKQESLEQCWQWALAYLKSMLLQLEHIPFENVSFSQDKTWPRPRHKNFRWTFSSQNPSHSWSPEKGRQVKVHLLSTIRDSSLF